MRNVNLREMLKAPWSSDFWLFDFLRHLIIEMGFPCTILDLGELDLMVVVFLHGFFLDEVILSFLARDCILPLYIWSFLTTIIPFLMATLVLPLILNLPTADYSGALGITMGHSWWCTGLGLGSSQWISITNTLINLLLLLLKFEVLFHCFTEVVWSQVISCVKDHVPLLDWRVILLVFISIFLLLSLVLDILFNVTCLNRQFMRFVFIRLFRQDSILLKLTSKLTKLFTSSLWG